MISQNLVNSEEDAGESAEESCTEGDAGEGAELLRWSDWRKKKKRDRLLFFWVLQVSVQLFVRQQNIIQPLLESEVLFHHWVNILQLASSDCRHSLQHLSQELYG